MAEESKKRALLSIREDKGGGLTIYRPIHKWTVEQVFSIAKRYGINNNKMYTMGSKRFGCLPCINCSKPEILNISQRWPDHIDRIEQWELIVGMVSHRMASTFFSAPGESETAYERGNIRAIVEWSKTNRGGHDYSIFSLFGDDSDACSSSYGLCGD